jgi:hypothetical protein
VHNPTDQTFLLAKNSDRPEIDLMLEQSRTQACNTNAKAELFNPDFPYKLHKPMLLIYNKAA